MLRRVLQKPLDIRYSWARDLRMKGARDRFDLVAAMPHRGSEKVLSDQEVRQRNGWHDGRWQVLQMMLADLKKAHVHWVVEPGGQRCT